MSLGYVDDNCFKDIANAIRNKSGSVSNYYPDDMANAINNISGGGANLGTKTVTSNGIYNAADDSLDGYNSVTVAVPMPTFNTDVLNVSANGVYNAVTSGLDGYSEVNVQVPSSFNSTDLTVTSNGVYNAQLSGYDGYVEVNVQVPSGGADLSNFISVIDTNNNPIGIQNMRMRIGNMYFNEPIVIGNGVSDCALLLSGCSNFNHSVTIPDSVINCDGMFSSCSNFNSPVTVGNNVVNCAMLFASCYNFNQPITIPDSVEDCREMLYSCYSFNQPITIGNSVIDTSYMFNGCSQFNKPVNIPNNVTNCFAMFRQCSNFNQDVVIPEGVTNCYEMFYIATNFEKSVVIPNSADNCSEMFYGQGSKRVKEVYVKNVQSNYQFYSAFVNWESVTNNITIYTDIASMEVLKNTQLTGSSILTWDSNNYNSQYKIQLDLGSKETFYPSSGQFNANFLQIDNGVLYKRTKFNYPITSQSIDNGYSGNSSTINTSMFNNIYTIDGGELNG